jgi:hypothetical protein
VPAAGRTARVLNPAPGASGARRGFTELAERLAAWAPRDRQFAARVRPPRAADLAARMTSEVSPGA